MTGRSLCLFVLVFGAAACTSTRIEYDRMTGTAFPTRQIRNDTTDSIPSIYARRGYIVAVDTNDTNIAALTGPANPSDPNQYDYITEAELDALETANRGSSVDRTRFICFTKGIVPTYCTQYHIYGVVVNHFYEDPAGVRSQSTMGIMWTADNRRAFANFYRNGTVSGDGGKYLRSTAHEIGHAFDLHHPDGDGSTDIMNQTGVVGNNYVYRFLAAASTDHLANHDKSCVWPSLSAFGATHTSHTDHGITSSACP